MVEPSFNMTGFLIKKKRLGHRPHTKGQPWEDTERKWPSACQGKQASEETKSADALIWDF